MNPVHTLSRIAILFPLGLWACRPPDPVVLGVTQPVTAITQAETLWIASDALHESRLINVHVPAAYPTSSERYPVLYMPDGGMEEDFPHVVATVDSLIALGRIRPLIVVGVPNTERRRDLSGPTRVAEDSTIAPRVGGSPAFRTFVEKELFPVIDARFRTTSERGLIGESLAGLFVLETFLATPEAFTHYIALDPSVWWNSGAMVDSAASPISRFNTAPRTLFLASSREPSTAEGSAKLNSTLQRLAPRGLRWRYLPRPDLTHANIFRTLKPEALIDAWK